MRHHQSAGGNSCRFLWTSEADLLHAEPADLLQQLEVGAQETAVAQLREAAGRTLRALQQHQARTAVSPPYTSACKLYGSASFATVSSC